MSLRSIGLCRIFTIVFLCTVTISPFLSSLGAQSGYPVSVAVGTQSLTVPWHTAPVTYRFNPALLVGTDTPLKSGESWRLLFGINVGFFRNHWWMTGVSLEPEIGIGRTLPGGLYTDVRLGVGYLHYFWRRKRLELEEGMYVPAMDWGSPSLIVPLSATLAYRGNQDDPLPVSPFVSARWGVQGLFRSGVSVATHMFLLGGVRIERQPNVVVGGR
jgi:hypothetical protein